MLTPLVLSLAASTVIATALGASTLARSDPASSCNVGHILCCAATAMSDDPPVAALLGLLGIVIPPPATLCGINCQSVSVIGIGGSLCTGTFLCCENVQFSPIVAFGCHPVVF